MKRLILGIMITFLSNGIVKAQTVKIAETPDTIQELKSGKWGPHLPNYFSWVIGAGLSVNQGIQDYTNVPGRYFETGFFYKYQFSKPLSIIFELDYQRITNIYSPLLATLPQYTTTRKQQWYNLNGMAGLSFDLKPNRGNVLGPSLDLFFVNTYNHRIGYKTIRKHTPSGQKAVDHLKNYRLNSRYMNGIRAELNLGALSFTYNYWFNPLVQIIDEGERVDFMPHMLGIKIFTTY